MIDKKSETKKEMPSPNMDSEGARRESVGRLLARTRAAYGQDLRSVSEALRIRYSYLEAIESGRIDRLPGPAYAIGFVRTYAEFLGLDREAVVEDFKQEVDGFDNQTQLHFLTPVPEGKIPGGAVFLVCAMVAGLAYGGWYYLSTQGRNVVDLIPEVPSNMQALLGQEELEPALQTIAARPQEASETIAPAADRPDQSETPALEQTVENEATATSTGASEIAQAAEVEPARETAPEAVLAESLASTEPLEEAPALDEVQTNAETAAQQENDEPATAAVESSETLAAVADEARRETATEAPRSSFETTAPVPAAPAVQQPTLAAPNSERSQSLVTASNSGVADASTTSVISSSTPPLVTDSRGTRVPVTPSAREPVVSQPLVTRPLESAGTAPRLTLNGENGGAGPANRAELAPVAAEPLAPTVEIPSPPEATVQVEPAESQDTLAQADGQDSNTPAFGSTAAIPAVPTGSGETAAYSDERAPITYGETNTAARVVLRAAQDCWVQVRDPNGILLLTRVLRAGDSYRVPNQRNLTLLTGNAGGLWIEVDGIRLSPLGPVGAVRRDVSLDPERLLSGTALNQ